MKIFINTLLVGIGLLFLSQTVLAAELDTSKIYNCKGMINGKQASVLYDARVVPERECQMGAEMAASFAQGMGKTVSIEEIKKSCISQYNADKAMALKLNAQGNCKTSMPGQPIFMMNN